MASLGSLTLNELQLIEVDQSPIVDPFDAPTGSLAILTDGSALFLKRPGDNSSWQNIGAFSNNIKRVGPSGAPYTSIAAAVADCTSASETNRYIILIEAGTYTEPEIVVPSYVSIVGMDEKAVKITAIGSNNVFKLTSPFVYISFLSIEDVPSGYSAISAINCGQYIVLHKVHIGNCGRGIEVISPIEATEPTYVYTEYCDVEECIDPIDVLGQGTQLAYMQNENLYVGNYFTNITVTEAITVNGNAQYVQSAGTIENLHSPGTLIGINAYNGAVVEISNTIINSWNTGLKIQNTGAACNLTLRFTNFTNNTTDCFIEQTTTTGVISCFADMTKMVINSNHLTVDIIDSANPGQVVLGGFYTGKTYDTISDFAPAFRRQFSPGIVEGGTLTHSTSSLSISVSSGIGYVVANRGLTTEFLKKVEWSTQSISVSANTQTYIYIDTNGTIQKAASEPDYLQNILCGTVIANNIGVFLNKNSQRSMYQNAANQEEMIRHVFGGIYVSGTTVTESGNRQLAVTPGEYYFGSNEYKPQGGNPISFTQIYRNGSGGFTLGTSTNILAASSSTWKYDNNSGTLANVPLVSYVNYRLYLVYEPNDGEEKYYLVMPQNTYLTQAAAVADPLPTVPTWFDSQVIRIADIIAVQGSLNITTIIDKRPLFATQSNSTSTAVTDHTALSNLTSGDAGHTQFVMTDGSKPMSSALQIQATSNQVQMGTGVNKVNLTSGTSIAERTYTIPDVGTTSQFVMNSGDQAISGIKTFNSKIVNNALTGNTVPYVNSIKELTSVALTNGQILMGSTGNAPAPATITGTTNQISVTNGASSITLATPQDIATTSNVTFNTVTVSGSDSNGNSEILSKGIKIGDTGITEASQVEGSLSYIAGATQDIHIKTGATLKRVHGFKESIQATANSTFTYTTTSANSIIFIGSVLGQVVNLGTATSMALGNKLKIANESSTIIRILNSASTKLEVLFPEEIVEITLIDNSTSIGVWSIRKSKELNNSIDIMDDFITGSTTTNTIGTQGWTATVGGTGTVTVTTASGLQEHGIITLNRNTTATNGFTLSLGTGALQIGDGLLICESRVKIPTQATASQDFNYFTGLGNQTTTTTEHTNGIYFLYSPTTSGGQNWILRTANGGTRTSVTGVGTASANTWYKLTYIVNAAGTNVDFYIDDIAVGSITTNIPTTLGNTVSPNMKLQGTVGTQTRTVVIDYFRLRKTFTTLR